MGIEARARVRFPVADAPRAWPAVTAPGHEASRPGDRLEQPDAEEHGLEPLQERRARPVQEDAYAEGDRPEGPVEDEALGKPERAP